MGFYYFCTIMENNEQAYLNKKILYIIDKKGLSKKYFGSIYLRLISNLKNEELLFGQSLLFYLIFSNQGNLSSGASTSIVFGPRNFLPVSSLHCPLGNITLRVCSLVRIGATKYLSPSINWSLQSTNP